MDRLKRCRFLLILSILLALVFAAIIYLFASDKLLRIGMLTGWVSMLLLAGAMYTEIRKIKKEQDQHHNI